MSYEISNIIKRKLKKKIHDKLWEEIKMLCIQALFHNYVGKIFILVFSSKINLKSKS